jgi:hypothetical protein
MTLLIDANVFGTNENINNISASHNGITRRVVSRDECNIVVLHHSFFSLVRIIKELNKTDVASCTV